MTKTPLQLQAWQTLGTEQRQRLLALLDADMPIGFVLLVRGALLPHVRGHRAGTTGAGPDCFHVVPHA